MNATSRRRSLVGVPLVRPIQAADLMLASAYPRPFDDLDWLFELKTDGLRCLISKDANRVQLLSRLGNPLTQAFPEVVAGAAALRGGLVLDAELSVDDARGYARFDRLQARARMSNPGRVRAAAAHEPARLYLFDILAVDGRDVRGLALV